MPERSSGEGRVGRIAWGGGLAIREAGVEEIAATPGFTRSLAEKVLAGL